MSYCGSRPGMCGRRPDCKDHYCPGRLHTEEGGETVDTEPLPSLIKGLAIFIGFALAAITAVALIAS